MNIVLKPFNLDQALDGAKVYTRGGLLVSQLKNFDDDTSSLIGIIHTSDNRSILGRWDSSGDSCVSESLDLFLGYSSLDTLYWINVYKKDDRFKVGKLHATTDEARAAATGSPHYFGTICFELDDLEKMI